MVKTFEETLAFLYTQLPMYQRQGKSAFKKDLTNIVKLLEYLGNPQQQFASIHVGGTNGKGSVSHFLAAALQASGLKTALYTSPHYKDFRERIKVDGQYISHAAVVDFVERIKPCLNEIPASFFEITVAMAFDYFAQQNIDVAIVEVGLGGRLDSTNVLKPELAVITNIGLDHQQMLGDTLALIAGEKAGIIKANTPVVIGQSHDETAPVFRAKAQAENAPLYFADRMFQADILSEDLKHTHYQVFRDHRLYHKALKVNWHGPFQQLNLQTALMALEVWQQHHEHRSINFNAVEAGVAQLKDLVRYQGRWQILAEQPLLLVDSAHNKDGLSSILPALQASTSAQLHIVLGVVNDKDLDGILPLFPQDAIYYFAKADIPRGLEAKVLKEKAAAHGLKGRAYVSVKNALKAAKCSAVAQDTIFVGGSIFTVAEVL